VAAAVGTDARRGVLPLATILPNQLVYRAVARQHYQNPQSGLFIPLDSAIADSNRWNGMRPT
jgi:hypothetical protein